MYGFITELQKDVRNPIPMTDTEVNEVQNLRKRAEALREELHRIDD